MKFSLLSQAVEFFTGLVFPASCLNCGADDEFVCFNCLSGIKLRTFNESWEKLVCDDCLDRVFIAGRYENELLKKMILNSKYQGQKVLLDLLGKLLLRFAQETDLVSYLGQGAVLLPLPLHPRRLRERGYNQSFILCQHLSRHFSLPIEESLLKRVKYTKHQVKLPAEKRRFNVRGVFKIDRKINILPDRILLVDDVVTTGASLNEAARTLKAAGVHKVFALVIAKN